jgi:hypothetical protein
MESKLLPLARDNVVCWPTPSEVITNGGFTVARYMTKLNFGIPRPNKASTEGNTMQEKMEDNKKGHGTFGI